MLSPTGEKKVGETIHFYSNEVEAEQNIQDCLISPPQIDFFRPFIKHQIYPIPKIDNEEQNSVYLEYTVELPLPT